MCWLCHLCACSQVKEGAGIALEGSSTSWVHVYSSIQPCKHIDTAARSSLVEKNWKKQSCTSILCSCENNVLQLLNKAQLRRQDKAEAAPRWALVAGHSFVTPSSAGSSTLQPSLELWPEDRKCSAAKTGCRAGGVPVLVHVS